MSQFQFPDEGFERYDVNDPCPVDPETYVELIIHTSEGYGSSGVVKAKYHHWGPQEDKLGEIVGYRIASGQSDPPIYNVKERF